MKPQFKVKIGIIPYLYLRYSYVLVRLHSFNRPDGIGTVTSEEKEKFDEIKERLRILLETQITHFRLAHNDSYVVLRVSVLDIKELSVTII